MISRYSGKFWAIVFLLCCAIPRLAAQTINEQDLPSVAQRNDLTIPETDSVDNPAYLQSLEKNYTKNKREQGKLVRLLKSIVRRRFEMQYPFSPEFYYHLANTYARLKLYPQAMKYYYYSIPLLQEKAILKNVPVLASMRANDTNDQQPDDDPLQTAINTQPETTAGITFSKDDTLFTGLEAASAVSQPIKSNSIVRPFRNGQAGIAYAIVLHIKQPAAGRRVSFTGINNVGHMFVTLIKYNEDQSTISRSFGFYPQKSNPLDATPLHPGAPATYKDDARHDWDEVVGKFVSRQRFFRILRLIKQYNRHHYNLNKNNCTDFGLCVAGMAGIQISDTRGSWPLGSGNTPASAGQSILEGNFLNMDTQDQNGLFISAIAIPQ